MAVTSVYNQNYLPAATNTEYTLFTSSAAGVYVMAAACPAAFVTVDLVEFRIYAVVNGGAEVLAYYVIYSGTSSSGSGKFSVPVPTATAGDTLRFTIKQPTGSTLRTFPIRIMTIG
jgi:hypothetical protein